MRLQSGGIDIWYIDESTDTELFALTAFAIPFLRQHDGVWSLVWEDHYEAIREWRRELRLRFGIPVAKELKATKLVAGRGRYAGGANQLSPTTGVMAYRWALSNLGFLQPSSIISVCSHRQSSLLGRGRLEAALIGLLQRMRTATERAQRNAMVFFDQGHAEYRNLYRQARHFLPTGSALNDWGNGHRSRNLLLSMFTKDANFKESHQCHFTQLADLLSFAVLAKIRHERGTLPPGQMQLSCHTLYDAVPSNVLNLHVTLKDRDRGILRL